MTKGTYAGGIWGWPWGGGAGGYIDNHGRIYPQIYGGTPRVSLSAGYTPDLEGLLTGTSVSGSLGTGPVRFNAGMSGNATGFGFGTPGVGVTYGFGPLEMSRDVSQPWVTPFIRDSAASAGVPSRFNVWEPDFPSSDAPNSAGTINKSRPSVFDTGTSPVMMPPSTNEPRGLPGMMVDAGLIDPANPDEPPPGGLLGLIQEYMRNNRTSDAAR